MVYFFTAKSSLDIDDFGLGDDSEHTIYMGKDKFENDPLIRKSHPKNLWFHVDKHSSAHLYLKLDLEQQNKKFEELKLDEELLVQIGQLTKANSIKANKLNSITIIYTPVDNLRTDGLMDTGTVTFVNPQKIKRIHIAKKDNAIVNRLNKTKKEILTEEFVKQLEAELMEWKRSKKDQERELEQLTKEQQKKFLEQKKFNKDPYADLFTEENLRASSNEFRNENWVEDEFW
ncbi:CIC11C00000002712 [Sungouiella intermedia]|uniref:CIC11C00000002712 n=1 Tax=Sungouiella intermedia TaxID=45354 RepID=A0A1L0BND0_9ASCO|nr:CIC11C00000002712 [[Candida] intermedia]